MEMLTSTCLGIWRIWCNGHILNTGIECYGCVLNVKHAGFVAKSGFLCDRLCFVADKHFTRNEVDMRHDDLDRKS